MYVSLTVVAKNNEQQNIISMYQNDHFFIKDGACRYTEDSLLSKQAPLDNVMPLPLFVNLKSFGRRWYM
jgi:hypothetical protein